MASDVALGVIAFVQVVILIVLIAVITGMRPRLRDLHESIINTLGSLQGALLQVETLVKSLRDSGAVDKLSSALSQAQGAVGKIEPLTADLSSWYAGGMVFVGLSILALAVWGFWTSLAGQRLWKSGAFE